MYQPKIQIYQKTNGSVAHFGLFVLSKLTVTFLKNETYGYGSQYNLKKPLVSVSYSNLVWNLALFNLAKQKLQIKYGFDLIITSLIITFGLSHYLDYHISESHLRKK